MSGKVGANSAIACAADLSRTRTAARAIAIALARFLAFILAQHALLFLLFSVLPKTASSVLGWGAADRHFVERINQALGLDGPWYRRYALHLAHAVCGDLGYSARGRFPVNVTLGQALIHSLPVFAAAAGGIVFGVAAAMWIFVPSRTVGPHRVLRALSAALLLPPFVTAVLAVSVHHWITASGVGNPNATRWACIVFAGLLFPMSLSFAAAGRACTDIGRQDFVRTYRGLGAGWWRLRFWIVPNLINAIQAQLSRLFMS